MDVFVIPLAKDRYELYCEPAIETEPGEEEAASLLPGREDEAAGPQRGRGSIAARWSRWRHRLSWTQVRRRFSRMLRAVEQRQKPAERAAADTGWMGRLQDRMVAWVAERVAEQRLLWNLRGKTEAVAVYPPDMTFEQVRTLVHRQLQHDFARHRVWFIIDAVLMVLSWPLTFVPGPNVLLFYFMLRVGGHWFSMRGARQGMHHVTWTGRPCPSLTELRDLAGLEPAAREQRVHDIAARLRLPHFSAFFARVA
jgi:hypothetical protein